MSSPSKASLSSLEQRAAADTTSLGTAIARNLIKTATQHLTETGPGPFPYEGVPSASEMTADEIEAAIATGTDPWSEDLNGVQPPPTCDLPLHSLQCALQFSALFPSADDIAAIFAPGAVTFITATDAAQHLLITDAIDDIIPAAERLTRHIHKSAMPVQIVTYDLRVFGLTLAKRMELRSSFAEKITGAMAIGRPVLAITDSAALLPDAARIAQIEVHSWPPVTGSLVCDLLRLTHATTGMIADVALTALLPSDEALAALSPTLFTHAFHAPTTLAVAQRLATYAAAPHKATSGGLTLGDVRGLPTLTTRLHEVIADLAAWRNGQVAWSDISASILLAGPPGTGKTMAAEALAGSAGVPFFATSFTDLQKNGHLGDYLKAMSEVVSDAIISAPSVIFFDELDSFGSRGSDASGRNGNYWTSVVNDLLQQLTRLNAAEGVIVIAATNHPEKIDPAITRSGRFDIKLIVNHPNKSGVRDIFISHLGASGFGTDAIDVDALVTDTILNQLIGLSGADLAYIARDAKSRARRAKTPLTATHVQQAANAAVPEGSKADLRRIAGHEAGHIVIAALLGLPLPILASATPAGGMVTRATPPVTTKDSAEKEMVYLFGGRAAEKLLCGNVSSGSGGKTGSDLDCATDLALSLETSWGLGDVEIMYAPLVTGERHQMRDELRSTVNQRLVAAEQLALATLRRNIDLLNHVANALLTARELDAAQITKLIMEQRKSDKMKPVKTSSSTPLSSN